MPDYQKMYTIAFNAISDALEELDRLNVGAAKEYLKEVQCHTEEIYISQGEEGSGTPGGCAGSPAESAAESPEKSPAESPAE